MKYILFTIENKQYAIEISRIHEVVRVESWESLPNMPAFLDGIIDLRGNIVPLVNIKKKFGKQEIEGDKIKRVIIAATDVCRFGIIVDKILGVRSLETIEIAPSDELLKEIAYLDCIGKNDNQLVPIINAAKLLTCVEEANIERVCEQAHDTLNC